MASRLPAVDGGEQDSARQNHEFVQIGMVRVDRHADSMDERVAMRAKRRDPTSLITLDVEGLRTDQGYESVTESTKDRESARLLLYPADFRSGPRTH